MAFHSTYVLEIVSVLFVDMNIGFDSECIEIFSSFAVSKVVKLRTLM